MKLTAINPKNNPEDSRAYANDLPGFVEKLQPTIRKAVSYLIYKGYFQAEYTRDIVQDVSLLLLEKGGGIIRQFKGNSAFLTYINAVIFNLCMGLYRSRRYRKEANESLDKLSDLTTQPVPQKVLDDEFSKLDLLFELFGKKKFRIILCLKLTYKLPVTVTDIENYDTRVSSEEREEILHHSNASNVGTKDKQIFETLLGVFNRLEGKDNSVDSTRKWVDVKTHEMIQFMNGEPPVASYNRETLQILIEKYFMRTIK